MYRTALSFCATSVRRAPPRIVAPLTLSAKPTLAALATTTTRLFASLPEPPTSNHLHSPVPGAQGSILYTETDEAPALATYCLYPIFHKVSFSLWCRVVVVIHRL